MTDYLLGKLSPEDQIRLEEQFFADDECFDQLVAVEDDLMYDYLRGRLPPADRQRFAQRFLGSPEDRANADFAQALLTVSHDEHQTGDIQTSVVSAFRRTGLRLGPATTLVRWSLAAAAVLVIAGGAWLATETIKLRHERQQFELARAAHDLALDRERSAQGRGTNQGTAGQPGQMPTIVALTLAPGLARGTDEGARVSIPAGADLLQIELGLKPNREYGQYRAALQNADGRDIWTQDRIVARRTPTGQAVNVTVPANLVTPGDYLLILKGLTARGDLEEAGDYAFRVLKR